MANFGVASGESSVSIIIFQDNFQPLANSRFVRGNAYEDRSDLSALHSRQQHLDGLVPTNVFKTKFVVCAV
jgi:hypothetical protein